MDVQEPLLYFKKVFNSTTEFTNDSVLKEKELVDK